MPAAATAYPASLPAAPVAPVGVWDDERFRLPAIFVGASLLAVGTFAVLHFTVGRRRNAPLEQPTRTDAGWSFPQAGVVLCPHGSGLPPTPKRIGPGSYVVLWLADPAGRFIETTWARVVRVDEKDANRIFVVLTGEPTAVGPRPLRREHGFSLSQAFWMTRDCVPEAIEPLADPQAQILCGPGLVTFDGPDVDNDPDGYYPAAPPTGSVESLVGRQVELLMVSRAGAGTAWQVRVLATIIDTGPIGQVPTVRVDKVEADEFADAPGGHNVKPGDTFDVTWDCIVKYRS